jgi:hypothetical protein
MNDDNVFVGLALVNVKDAKLICKKKNTWMKKMRKCK